MIGTGLFVLMIVAGGKPAADVKGAADHPLFTRMPDFVIVEHRAFDHQRERFDLPSGRPAQITGRVTRIRYNAPKGSKVSPLEVVRNHTAAFRKIGGEVLRETDYSATMKLTKGDQELWASVEARTGRYVLVVCEKAALARVVRLGGRGPEHPKDVAGSADPLFSRMPGFFIDAYQEQEFGKHDFAQPKGRPVRVEGKKTSASYRLAKGDEMPNHLEVVENYLTAAKDGGARVIKETEYSAIFVLASGGKETWVDVDARSGYYRVTAVERGEMVQKIGASDMLTALEKEGHIALYIQFDLDQATIKPESKGIIDELVTLLGQSPKLAISVEGHTDSTGSEAHNLALSTQRAEAVRAAILAAGVDPARVDARGLGQGSPIADNATEDGRAKNRRVELVRRRHP